jgi:hypothetical protein
MSKVEFLEFVRRHARLVEYRWSPAAPELRECDPVLAELVGRWQSAYDAVAAYCKGRTEGK